MIEVKRTFAEGLLQEIAARLDDLPRLSAEHLNIKELEAPRIGEILVELMKSGMKIEEVEGVADVVAKPGTCLTWRDGNRGHYWMFGEDGQDLIGRIVTIDGRVFKTEAIENCILGEHWETMKKTYLYDKLGRIVRFERRINYTDGLTIESRYFGTVDGSGGGYVLLMLGINGTYCRYEARDPLVETPTTEEITRQS